MHTMEDLRWPDTDKKRDQILYYMYCIIMYTICMLWKTLDGQILIERDRVL